MTTPHKRSSSKRRRSTKSLSYHSSSERHPSSTNNQICHECIWNKSWFRNNTSSLHTSNDATHAHTSDKQQTTTTTNRNSRAGDLAQHTHHQHSASCPQLPPNHHQQQELLQEKLMHRLMVTSERNDPLDVQKKKLFSSCRQAMNQQQQEMHPTSTTLTTNKTSIDQEPHFYGRVLLLGGSFDNSVSNMILLNELDKSNVITVDEYYIAEWSASLLGNEVSPIINPPISTAASEFSKLRQTVCCGDPEALPWAEEMFDTVVCTHALCCVSNVGAVLKEIVRVLKPGGLFYFLEHVIEQKFTLAKVLHELHAPIKGRSAHRCHSNRTTRMDILGQPGFMNTSMERFSLRFIPHISGSAQKVKSRSDALRRRDATSIANINDYIAIALQ